MDITRRTMMGISAMFAAFGKRMRPGDEGQPVPILTRTVRFRVGRKIITAIMRHWRPGDSGPNGRCKLCPICRAYGDGCLIVIGKNVSRKDARVATIRGARDQRTGKRLA